MANVSLRPPGAKFYGAYYKTQGTNATEISSQYVDWDFDNTFRPQIDACKAIGANFLAISGTPFWTVSALSTNDYVSRRCEIADYMAEIGMFLLPYGMLAYSAWNGATNAEVSAVCAAEAEQLSKRLNVIGYVTMDEPWLGSVVEGGAIANATVVANAADQYATVKASVPSDFGVCVAPNPCGDPSIGTSPFGYTGSTGVYTSTRGRCDFMAQYCDFFAFHPFYAVAAADSATLRAAFPGKDLLMPSSVLVQVGDGDIAEKFAATMGIVGTNSFRGMANFATLDAPSALYGMFNAGPPITNRATITSEFTANLPTVVDPARTVRMFPGNPRLNQHIRWGYL